MVLCVGVCLWRIPNTSAARRKGMRWILLPGQAMGRWDAALLALETGAWEEFCGWMLNGSALLAGLKRRLDIRFLANHVNA